jgi:hypothetical protein
VVSGRQNDRDGDQQQEEKLLPRMGTGCGRQSTGYS